MKKNFYSNYDTETGISTARILTNIGIFEGYCKLHEEDKDIESKFFGCRIANMRAYDKYLKARIKITKVRLETINNLIKQINYVNTAKDIYTDIKSIEQKQIIKYKKSIEKELIQWKQNSEILEQQIYKILKNHRQDLNKIHKKIENNNKKKKEKYDE